MSLGTIFLFDIDGTLISTVGAARQALEIAVAEHLGLSSFKATFGFGGMTDRVILGESLASEGAPADDVAVAAIMERYLGLLETVMADAPNYVVHPGIVTALDALKDRARCALGLGTGNVEAGARIKLKRVALNPYFDFGGYGDDSPLRPQLIAAGIRRGADVLGLSPDECTTVVIGDTIRDVTAAHANGAVVLGVGTGGVPLEVLRDAGAEHVYETLADEGALDCLLRYCT